MIYEGIVRSMIYYHELFNLKPKTLREEGDNFSETDIIYQHNKKN